MKCESLTEGEVSNDQVCSMSGLDLWFAFQSDRLKGSYESDMLHNP